MIITHGTHGIGKDKLDNAQFTKIIHVVNYNISPQRTCQHDFECEYLFNKNDINSLKIPNVRCTCPKTDNQLPYLQIKQKVFFLC